MSETYLLNNKVALVTGSGRGQGRVFALELARRGASVVINYAHSASEAESVVAEIKALGRDAIAVQADVADPAQIVKLFEAALSHFGRLDAVVSNSGIESFGHVADITVDEFDRVFRVNTRGQLLVAQEAYKCLGEGGRVVLMSSISAQAKGVAKHALYSGSKAAVEAFVRCAALDMADKKITINAIAPGGIMTDMARKAAHLYLPDQNGGKEFTKEELEKVMASFSPLKRPGLPDDTARVVAFLCSDDAGWVTGQTITIAGGAPM